MKCFTKTAALSITVLALMEIGSSQARADYVVSVWRNDTNVTVVGGFQWGDGPWTDFRVEPNRTYGVWRNMDAPPCPLVIRFDVDPGPGIDMIYYKLRVFRSPTTVFDAGPTEVFVVRPDGRVDLRSTRN